jgi:non-canonical (house-cleaning) NTP pyrophosphatase
MSETRCVAVGSTNKVKVNACRISFERAFLGDAIDVQGFSTSSGVPAQPVGDAETRRGAVNRALAAAAAWEAAHGRAPDFSVGLEGGVYYEPAFRPTPEEDGSGRTGGPTAGVAAASSDGAAAAPPAGETMWCCAWMAVYEPATGSWGYGRTGSFQLPNVLMSLVRGAARGGGRRRGQALGVVVAAAAVTASDVAASPTAAAAGGMELGHADDMVFGRVGSKEEEGCVRGRCASSRGVHST